MLGPDLFLLLNSKQMNDKYIHCNNIFTGFLIAGLYKEILCKFHRGENPAGQQRKSLQSSKRSD